MQFQLKEINRDGWNEYWCKIAPSPLVQSWEYGAAKASSSNWQPYRYVFADEKDEVIAAAQIFVRDIPILGKIARINRGPLIIGNKDSVQTREISNNIYRTLLKSALKKRWHILIVSPEIEYSNQKAIDIFDIKFFKNYLGYWGSSLLDLNASVEQLKTNLKGKWRNCLMKSLRSDVTIIKERLTRENLGLITRFYENAQAAKNFKGISSILLKTLCEEQNQNFGLHAFFAYANSNKELIGILLIAQHGTTSTYWLGNTTAEGRKYNVNYSMLWSAILDAKKNGCEYFDTGGISSKTPEGIKKFKQGINGLEYKLANGFVTIPKLDSIYKLILKQ